jgi:hypothetical protein
MTPLPALLPIGLRNVLGGTRHGQGGSRKAAKSAVDRLSVALAVTACITHLKHTAGSVITVDAGRYL